MCRSRYMATCALYGYILHYADDAPKAYGDAKIYFIHAMYVRTYFWFRWAITQGCGGEAVGSATTLWSDEMVSLYGTGTPKRR